MCGIVGIMTTTSLSIQERNLLRWLSYFDYPRGTDATGYFWVDQTNNASYIKGVGSPQDLWTNPGSRALMDIDGEFKAHNLRVLVGHNRAKTRGANTSKNAHPFLEGDVIGVHNGTTRGTPRALPKGAEYEVDSQAVMHALNEGWDMARIEKEVDLDMALVFYNAKTKIFTIGRNSARPMWYTWNKSHTTLMFASMPWILYAAVGAMKCGANWEEPKEVEAFTQWEFDFNKRGLEVFKTAKVSSFEKRPPFTSTVGNNGTGASAYRPGGQYGNNTGYGNNRPNYAQNRHGKGSPAVRSPVLGVPNPKSSRDAWFAPKFSGKSEFDQKTGCQCAFCSNGISFEEFQSGSLRFLINQETAICTACVLKTTIEG
jgi:predicted glutamine amidotransferase